MQRPAHLMMWWRKSNRGGPLHWWQLPACRHGHSRCPTRWRRPKPSDRSGQSSSGRRCRPVFRVTNKRNFFKIKKLLKYSNNNASANAIFRTKQKFITARSCSRGKYLPRKRLRSLGHFPRKFHSTQCHNSIKCNLVESSPIHLALLLPVQLLRIYGPKFGLFQIKG